MIKALAGAIAALTNFSAAAPPSTTDDLSKGYSAGSAWMVPASGSMWRARSVVAGAASWIKLAVLDHPGYVAGRYYVPAGQGNSVGSATTSVGTAYFGFGTIKERVTISQLGARIATLSAGGNFQLAVYTHNPATAMPGTLVAATGSGSTANATIVNVPLLANVTIEPGFYWFAYSCDNTTAAPSGIGGAATDTAASLGSTIAAITNSSTGQVAGVTAPIAFGSWPADVSALAFTEATARSPMIQFLVASVP